jgi:hypothetical protein
MTLAQLGNSNDWTNTSWSISSLLLTLSFYFGSFTYIVAFDELILVGQDNYNKKLEFSHF